MNKSVRDELKEIVSEVVEEKLKELFEENLILMTEHLTEVIKENMQKSGGVINENTQPKENKFKSWLSAFSEEESPYVQTGGGDFSPGMVVSKSKKEPTTKKPDKGLLGNILSNTRPLSGHEQMDG